MSPPLHTAAIDLTALQPPAVVETLDYEAVLAELKADLISRAPELTEALNLESEPLIKLLEVVAFRELILRARINDAARANLLAFARETDLDHLGAFYGVERLADESDERLRDRIQARIAGWSTAGAAVHYRYWALSASSDIADVSVDSPEPGRVRIAVLPTGHEADVPEDLLDTVRAVVLREDVRVLTDTVEVVGVTLLPVTVTAQIWLYPETDIAVFAELEPSLMEAVEREALLGWNLARSWIISQLHLPGVQRVVLDSPGAEIVVAPNEAIRITGISLTLAGRDY